MTSFVKGKFLSDFPEIVKHIDMSKHINLDTSKIQAGSNKIILNWICVYCKESYKRNVNQTVSGSCCPNKECIMLKRTKTNNERFGWNPRINKRMVKERREVQPKNDNDIEIWKDLPSELLMSKYQVSNLGRIKNKKTQYILTQNPRPDGYIRNSLHLDNNIQKSFLCHILVAKTFILNPENKPTVNHINIIRSDNRVINLEWATYSEQSFKENKKSYKTNYGKSINQYDLDNNFIKTWNKLTDVENELNIDKRNISAVLRGKRTQSGGFIWKYNIKNTDIEGEIWKKFTDEVLVSNLGRIKIKDNEPTYGTLKSNGYYQTKIIIDKKYKTYLVHRLVCLTFLENPENKPFVNHKDENRSNNKLENLEWITNKENVNYSLDIKGRYKENKRSKKTFQIDSKTNKVIKEFRSIYRASKETGINFTGISNCCKGKQNTAGGYNWSH